MNFIRRDCTSYFEKTYPKPDEDLPGAVRFWRYAQSGVGDECGALVVGAPHMSYRRLTVS
jgi:hypothetical protein